MQPFKYIADHAMGRLSLRTSFWINGILGYALFYAVMWGLSQFLPRRPSGDLSFIIYSYLFIIWLGWALIGIVMSSVRVLRAPNAKSSSELYALLALGVVLGACIYVSHDVIKFAGKYL